MRPNTLAETGNRIASGEPAEKALAEFLDQFYGAPTADSAHAMLQEAPLPTGIEYVDALLGAVADYLSMQYLRRPGPGWSQDPIRFLAKPFFTAPVDTVAARAWLLHSSPAEFKHHNIFTEARPLRRKRSERPAWEEIRDTPDQPSL